MNFWHILGEMFHFAIRVNISSVNFSFIFIIHSGIFLELPVWKSKMNNGNKGN